MNHKRTYGKAFMNLGLAAVIVMLMIMLVPKCLSFFLPFVIGFIVSALASKPVQFLEEKLKIKRRAGTVCVIIFVLAMIIAGIYAVGLILTEQVKGFLEELPMYILRFHKEIDEIDRNMTGVYQRLPSELQIAWDNVRITTEKSLMKWITELGKPSFITIGNIAKQLPSLFIGIIMTLMSAYFFTAERSALHNFFHDYMPEGIQKYYRMIREGMRSALGGYVKAQLKIEVWVYAILVAGLLLLRVKSALLIAAGIAVVDLLPVFGAGTILWPWALFMLLGKDYPMAVGLMIIWIVTQVFRQILQPKIVGDMVGISPIPTLFLLYIGYKIGGLLGLILSVPFGIILLNMYQAGVFDTVMNSVRILVSGLNRYRRFEPEDLRLLQNEDEKQSNQ